MAAAPARLPRAPGHQGKAMSHHISLILHNAHVITMDPLLPRAEAVAVAGGRIAAVGRDDEVLALRPTGARLIDCRGLTLVPGLHDAHCHLLATASSLSGLGCRPNSTGSLDELLQAIKRRAAETQPGRWIRGFGLDPAQMWDGRFPTRRELDQAAPANPIRLDHDSGHAVALNSLALAAAGIDSATPDPVEGLIERDSGTGEPTGVLYEAAAFLRDRLGNTRSAEELREEVARLSRKLLSYGITSVQDAGHNNGMGQWNTLESLVQGNVFIPRVTMMAGATRISEFLDSGLGWGSGNLRLRLGHAKVMLTLTTGALHPGQEDLASLADKCLDSGFPFAVHTVEKEALAAVLALPQLAKTPAPGAGAGGNASYGPPPNRVEHAAECPPDLMVKLGNSGAMVVTQPGFIYWRGDRYLQQVEPGLQKYLYDFAEMRRRRIPVAFSSDCPVIEPSPWPGIFSALTSGTAQGNTLKRGMEELGQAGGLSPVNLLSAAVEAYSAAGARAEGTQDHKGAIRRGMLADMALVELPQPGEPVDGLPGTRARLTILGGRVVWEEELGN